MCLEGDTGHSFVRERQGGLDSKGEGCAHRGSRSGWLGELRRAGSWNQAAATTSVTLLPGLLELVEDLGRVLLPAGGEGDKVDLGLLDGKAKHT